ncbi:hypothetical protein EBS80_00340 [bacterium]|nr:hypothetical protein [bacterium]
MHVLLVGSFDPTFGREIQRAVNALIFNMPSEAVLVVSGDAMDDRVRSLMRGRFGEAEGERRTVGVLPNGVVPDRVVVLGGDVEDDVFRMVADYAEASVPVLPVVCAGPLGRRMFDRVGGRLSPGMSAQCQLEVFPPMFRTFFETRTTPA